MQKIIDRKWIVSEEDGIFRLNTKQIFFTANRYIWLVYLDEKTKGIIGKIQYYWWFFLYCISWYCIKLCYQKQKIDILQGTNWEFLWRKNVLAQRTWMPYCYEKREDETEHHIIDWIYTFSKELNYLFTVKLFSQCHHRKDT